MFKKLALQLKLANEKNKNITSPFSEELKKKKNEFLKGLSKKAVELYEKQKDIKKFTKLVLSDPENLSHNKYVDELFENGDPFVDDKLAHLADNKKLLKDLGLID